MAAVLKELCWAGQKAKHKRLSETFKATISFNGKPAKPYLFGEIYFIKSFVPCRFRVAKVDRRLLLILRHVIPGPVIAFQVFNL